MSSHFGNIISNNLRLNTVNKPEFTKRFTKKTKKQKPKTKQNSKWNLGWTVETMKTPKLYTNNSSKTDFTKAFSN